jgi:hypothetical protein
VPSVAVCATLGGLSRMAFATHGLANWDNTLQEAS